MIWIDMLSRYIPERYQVASAHVVDSRGNFSEQIDVVVFDRQYSPFIFTYEDQLIVPAESVYAVFETKQTVSARLVQYAQDKVASVRNLHRTSLPIPHAGGVYDPKQLIPIIGGLLTFESEWKPPMGSSFEKALSDGKDDRRLDIGCVASHGHFMFDDNNGYDLVDGSKPATAFLFALISRLQFSGTVPMIDIDAYGDWLRN